MFDPEELPRIRSAIRECTQLDRKLLEEIRDEVRTLQSHVRTIKPRTTTSISLVASDGGNNKLVFDPFYLQLVRVVDSYGKQLCLDTVSPTSDTDTLSSKQFGSDGKARTALGQLMLDLGVSTLDALSHMIPAGRQIREKPTEVSPSWVLVYRDICEWAVLYDRICHTRFGTDTLIVRDGLLRSKVFRGELFVQMCRRIEDAIAKIQREDRRRVFLVGLAKHSKVLMRYQLGMSLEETFPAGEPRFVHVPRELEAKAYVWPEYARGRETEGEAREAPKFVAGDMYFVRFGDRGGDPVWAVDILSSQSKSDSEIFGYLLADAIYGFPVPFYPRCLQKAHEYAQVVDFDLEILQHEIFDAVRGLLPEERRRILDALQLTSDLSARRYE